MWRVGLDVLGFPLLEMLENMCGKYMPVIKLILSGVSLYRDEPLFGNRFARLTG